MALANDEGGISAWLSELIGLLCEVLCDLLAAEGVLWSLDPLRETSLTLCSTTGVYNHPSTIDFEPQT